MKNKEILAIIPAYNEEKSIGNVLKKFSLNLPDIDLLVIDDASQDNTKRIVYENNVNIISLPFNLGIGGAVQTGLKYAYHNNYETVIRTDADGQHPVEEISKLIDYLYNSEDVDMVIGSRYKESFKYKGSKTRKFATAVLSNIVSLVIRQKITDVTSGFFVLDRKAMRFLADYSPEDYPEVESIILLKKNNFNIAEVSVSMEIRMQGNSSITPLKSVYYIIRVILAILICSFKIKTELME